MLVLAHLLPAPVWDLFHWTVDTGPNGGYGFFSGIGSDLGEVTLIIGIAGWWHHVNCVKPRCWRKGHRDPGHGHPVCRRHQDRLPNS